MGMRESAAEEVLVEAGGEVGSTVVVDEVRDERTWLCRLFGDGITSPLDLVQLPPGTYNGICQLCFSLLCWCSSLVLTVNWRALLSIFLCRSELATVLRLFGRLAGLRTF